MAAISQNNHYLIHWCNKVHYLNGGIKLPLEVIVCSHDTKPKTSELDDCLFLFSPGLPRPIPGYLKQKEHIALRFAALAHFTRELLFHNYEVKGAAKVAIYPLFMSLHKAL